MRVAFIICVSTIAHNRCATEILISENVYCTCSLQNIENFMLMRMPVHGEFLSRQETQQTATKFFFRKERHIRQRQFVIAS